MKALPEEEKTLKVRLGESRGVKRVLNQLEGGVVWAGGGGAEKHGLGGKRRRRFLWRKKRGTGRGGLVVNCTPIKA